MNVTGKRVPATAAGIIALLLVGASIGPASAQTTTTVTAVSSVPTSVAATSTVAPSGPTTSAVPTTSSTTGSSTTGPGTATSTTAAAPTTTVVGPTSSTTVPTTTSTTLAPFVPGRVLKMGSKGDDVMALELRLDELHFDVGKVDGRYDLQTWQGVMAFQKLNGLQRSGTFGVQTQKAFAVAVPLTGGLVPNGGLPRVEVDISRQVLLYFDKSGLARITAISSGSGRKYCDNTTASGKPNCGDAKTPRGNFRIQRRIKGVRVSDLGELYNPVYFNGGFAVHGSPSVPGYPASHGCVRVTNKTADWFFDEVKTGTPVYVYD